MPVVYRSDEGRESVMMRWGLIPFWFKDDEWKASTFNARVENMHEKPSYRGPWKTGQRCLFPARGFYEWQEVEGQEKKQRWYIRLPEYETMAMAGIWDCNKKLGLSATIVTMPANELMRRIQNSGKNKHRMPLFVEPDNFLAWLDGANDAADELMQPYPSARMEAWPVSSRVTPEDLVKP